MEKFNRAVRRHHVERLKEKRRVYWGFPSRTTMSQAREPMDRMRLGKVVQYPTTCSSPWCCGNPRLREGDTYRDKGMFQRLLQEE